MLGKVFFVNVSTMYIGCIPDKKESANPLKVLLLNYQDPVGESIARGIHCQGNTLSRESIARESIARESIARGIHCQRNPLSGNPSSGGIHCQGIHCHGINCQGIHCQGNYIMANKNGKVISVNHNI